jgi:Protein of unknown function (DUF1553)/Protein of unknown function (DUF1549)/Planctomycete cytochrome C
MLRFVSVLCAGACLTLQCVSAADEPPAFARDVRPILANKCFKCHGPDEEFREADLRLDTADGATADLGGYAAIVPGRPDRSVLIERITTDDPDERMPPADSKLSLKRDEIEMLRRWIESGAEYQQHWAFVPPAESPLPEVSDPAWCRNAIDRYVLARLDREGLSPSPEADEYKLVRRVYLDLVGLTPGPEKVDAYVADQRADKYERLVDELLTSPEYGERWARRWLDLARYSDTNGYEKDRERSIWPYRDWVINALNAGMPFDQFTVEQIAGDMLPHPTPEQLIATGFHRNTMINEEGGVDVEEFRFDSIVDRVATTGTVWLGLTVGCAQCHNHKYDPISQREFYELFAFLDNANEPEMPVTSPEISAERQRIQQQITDIESQYAANFPSPDGTQEGRRRHLQEQFTAWQQEVGAKSVAWTPVRPRSKSSHKHATLTVLDDDSILASGDIPNNDTYDVAYDVPPGEYTALRLEVLPDDSLPNHGPGRSVFNSGAGSKGDFLLSEINVALAGDGQDAPAPVSLVNATQSHALNDTRGAAAALDGVTDTGWSIGDHTGEPHQAVFPFAEPLHVGDGDALQVRLVQQYIHQMTIGRFRVSLTSSAGPVVASGLPAEIEQIIVTPEAERTPAQQSSLLAYYLSVAPELEEQHQRVAQLRASLPEYPTTMIMRERTPQHARTAYVHHRGEFLKPTDPVEPAVPEALPGLPAGAPVNRLSFAQWLVSGDNPLTARVTMNRAWQAFFGRGLVETVEDFGTQGSLPTHPRLLDWLAVEFKRSGWNVKEMHRRIVTSSTYRQSSAARPELLEHDPENRWLARGPRFRVDAEMVRDVALSASGLLEQRIGGPSVYPPQPAGVVELAYGDTTWPTATGPDRYRRGLYTFMKRTAPYAMTAQFGAPSGEVCVARRERSNTPLQALMVLNDTVFIEAARALAANALADAAVDRADRVRTVFRRVLTRPPSPGEVDALIAFLDTQLERLRSGGLNAHSLLGVESNDAPTDGEIEQAAWTTLCRALLNLDEAITKE